ncbi:hypothetical protein ACFKA9_000908 [Vibrio parahaemolyticus]
MSENDNEEQTSYINFKSPIPNNYGTEVKIGFPLFIEFNSALKK